jgi:hypothetical protein
MVKPIYHIMTFDPGFSKELTMDELVETLIELPISIGIAPGYELPINRYVRRNEAEPILEVDSGGSIISLRPQKGMRLSDAAFCGDSSMFDPSRIMDECTGGGACSTYEFLTERLGLPFNRDLMIEVYKLGTKEEREPMRVIYPEVLVDRPQPPLFDYDELCDALCGKTQLELIRLVSREWVGPLDTAITDKPRTRGQMFVDRLELFQNVQLRYPLKEGVTLASAHDAFIKFRNYERCVHPGEDHPHRAYWEPAYARVEVAHELGNVEGFVNGLQEMLDMIVHD